MAAMSFNEMLINLGRVAYDSDQQLKVVVMNPNTCGIYWKKCNPKNSHKPFLSRFTTEVPLDLDDYEFFYNALLKSSGNLHC